LLWALSLLPPSIFAMTNTLSGVGGLGFARRLGW